MKSDLVDIKCRVIRETDKAWLVDDGRRREWLPKSQCEIEFVSERLSVATMRQWLARDKGLI